MTKSTKLHKFTSETQAAFAELSGDYNPLHVDPLLARRLLYGGPVVHGIHCLLWALETWAAEHPGHFKLHSVDVAFFKPLRVGHEALFTHHLVGERGVKMEIMSGETVLTRIAFEWEPVHEHIDQQFDKRSPEKRQPIVQLLDKLEDRTGSVELCFNPEAAAEMFPLLSKQMPGVQMAVLLATTRLVGMECPGWHSLYSELNLTAQPDAGAAELEYQVTKFNRRFGMIHMQVAAEGLAGKIQAFVRPAPPEPVSYAKVKALVRADEFLGQRALIIGGSRGLGEVTAKLLAAGGAEVLISYHQGEAEARRIVEEIKSQGGRAGCLQVNVLNSSSIALADSLRAQAPTHLYYFATPFIFAGSKGAFSGELFRTFCDYYVTGFANVVGSLKGLGLRKVFHPSTVAVEDTPPEMAEYAAAKAAAETLCATLEKTSNPPLVIYKPRLPRLATDQTVSLWPVKNEEPVSLMLDHLRRFR